MVELEFWPDLLAAVRHASRFGTVARQGIREPRLPVALLQAGGFHKPDAAVIFWELQRLDTRPEWFQATRPLASKMHC